MGLGNFNPGCNNCRCCDICADFATDWYFSACKWDGPSQITSQLNGLVFDAGLMTPELQTWAVDSPLRSGDVWYCESRIELPDIEAIYDVELERFPTPADHTATIKVDNLRLVFAFHSLDSKKCERLFFGGMEHRITLLELRDGSENVVDLDDVTNDIDGSPDPLQATLTLPNPVRFGYDLSLGTYKRCNIRGKDTAPGGSADYRFGLPGGSLGISPDSTIAAYYNYLRIVTPASPSFKGTIVLPLIKPRLSITQGMHAQTTAVFTSCCPAVGDFEELEASISTTEDLPAVFRQGEETVLPIDFDNVVAGSVIALSLPTGLELDEAASEVRGDPSQPPGTYTFYLQGLVDTGPHAGCTVKGTFSVLVTDCPDPTDYDELGATLAPIAAHSTEPRPFSKAGSLGNIARFLCTDCDYAGATVEGLPAGLDALSGTGTWGDSNLWFVGTPDSGVTNGLYTITLRTTVTDGDHEGCEIFREYEIEVTD
jgi:hypothetical protein